MQFFKRGANGELISTNGIEGLFYRMKRFGGNPQDATTAYLGYTSTGLHFESLRVVREGRVVSSGFWWQLLL